MFEYLYEWMKNIAFYMVLITAVIHILPNSDYKKYIRFFTGMVLVVMLATPLLKIFGMEHPLGSLYNSKEYQEQMKKIEEESKYLGETLPEGYPDDAVQEPEDEKTGIEVEEIQSGRYEKETI